MLVNGATVALNAQEDVILSDDGMSQLEYYFPFEYVESPEFLKDCTPAPLLGDTRCQAMRQKVMPAKFQPHASQMHLKWAEIGYCAQYAVYSNQ